jgi:hypothetical protein
MIEYVTDTSPFYLANKAYCEGVDEGLKALNAEPSGFCNSYGYEINASFTYNNLSYNVHFEKHQSTQNGIIVPVDALDYAGVTITTSGLEKRYTVKLGQSKLLRMLMTSALKCQIPAPYYVQINSDSKNLGTNFLTKLIGSGVSLFRLENGKVVCKLHTPEKDPQLLVARMDRILNELSRS